MNLLPIYATAACLLAAVATALAVGRFRGLSEPGQPRFVTLDGLRGYLALCVVIHHASIWPEFLRTGAWQLPPSRLFATLGQASVALFFMLTSFLFMSRLLDREHPIDWLRLYVSRCLRLLPLYVVCMLMLYLLISILSKGDLAVPGIDAGLQAAQWLAFTMFGAPEINRVQNTSVITAAAFWALPYEIVFYALLPLAGAALGRRVPLLTFLPVVLAAWYLLFFPTHLQVFAAFSGGAVAAVVCRLPSVQRVAPGAGASVLALACVAGSLTLFDSAYGAVPLVCLALAFTIVAAGNDFFGVLSSKISRSLGQLSYGMFLLHGLLLFTVLRFALGYPSARDLTDFQFWSIVTACIPVLVVLAVVSLDWIESPALRKTDFLGAWISARYRRSGTSGSTADRG